MPEIRTPIVGSQYHEGAVEALGKLPRGARITLRRGDESAREHDRLAVACWSGEQMLGFIPRSCPEKSEFCRRLEVGEELWGEIYSEAIIADGRVRFAPKVKIVLKEKSDNDARRS